MNKSMFSKKTSPYLIKKCPELQQKPVWAAMIIGGLIGGAIGCFMTLWLNLLTDGQLGLFGMFLISAVPGAWMGGIIRSIRIA